MDYKIALKQLEKGSVLPVYLCYGPDKYRMEEFVAHFVQNLIEPEHRDFAISKYDLAETRLDEVLDDAETMPFMVPRKLIIAQNALFFTGAKESTKVEHRLERLLQYIKSPVDYAIIIFTVDADKLDERKKVVKAFKDTDRIVPFPLLSPDGLHQWIVRNAAKLNFTFAPGAMEHFLLYTGTNLQSISTELEKLSIYLGKDGEATAELISQLVIPSTEQNIFILIEDIVQLRLARALTILSDLLKQREEPIKIMVLIARQFRIMLQAKELEHQGYSQQQIASQIGVHPYAVKLAIEQGRKYTQRKLSEFLAQLAELDYKIKSGKIDKVLGLEMFILKLGA